jgi:hypothetical protein
VAIHQDCHLRPDRALLHPTSSGAKCIPTLPRYLQVGGDLAHVALRLKIWFLRHQDRRGRDPLPRCAWCDRVFETILHLVTCDAQPPTVAAAIEQARQAILHESRHLHYDERWMSAFYAWSGPTNRTGLFDSVFEHCLCSFRLIAVRPHGTLLRDIVLFGLYLRLGQLLVPDGTVMLALDASRPWKRCVEVLKRLPLSGFLPLDDTAL